MDGPQFIRYFAPLLSALQELGNSGTPAEAGDLVARKLNLSDAVLNEQTQNGQQRFHNQVAWARFYLSKAGYIDSSKRGVWALTEKGINAKLSKSDPLKIFQQVRMTFRKATGTDLEDDNTDDGVAPSESGVFSNYDHRTALLEILRSIPPAAFEKLCQRLLREAGFQQVEITGRSNDGGIDGKGRLQVNGLLSFHVIFQCKRYSNTQISPSQIRDFRGSMSGRTDKGIFLTTSNFSVEAQREASRDGVPPIELVDAEKLVDMFEQLELGLVRKIVYDIDRKFFEEFK